MFSGKRVIGLDIGTTSIKMIELSVDRKSASIINAGFMPIKRDTLIGGSIADPATLSQYISELHKQSGFKNKQVCVGLFGTAVMVKKISMPKISKKLIGEQLRWESEQYLSVDINELSVGYHIIENRKSSSSDLMDILLVAAKHDQIFRYVECMQASSLKAKIVDVAGLALANCLEFNYGKQENEIIIIINVGASVTNFVVVEKTEVTFLRDIPIGGINYTNEINMVMGLSFEEAEILKINASSGQEAPEEVSSIMASTNENVLEEILATYQLYLSDQNAGEVTKIYLSGGGIFAPGLGELINQAFDVPCEYLDPFLKVKNKNKKISNEFLDQIRPIASVALGLSLRRKSDS